MQILVDDQPYEAADQANQTVGELASEICNANETAERRIVVALCCNGEPVADDDLATALETPLARFDRLELQTQPVAALVRATLTQAIELFDHAAAVRHQAADFLAEGQHNAAMQQLQKFLDIWRQVQQTVLVCAQSLGLDLDRLEVRDLKLTEILELIKTQLSGLKDAIGIGDFVVVGDILRYEFDEPLANWAAVLHHLRQEADAVGSP